MSNKKFIITHDRDIGRGLKELGFVEIPSNSSGIYTFVNDAKILFTADIDMSKVSYSNKIFY